MVYTEMPCRAKIARESRSLLDVAMKNHIRECDFCVKELINDFVDDADVDGDE